MVTLLNSMFEYDLIFGSNYFVHINLSSQATSDRTRCFPCVPLADHSFMVPVARWLKRMSGSSFSFSTGLHVSAAINHIGQSTFINIYKRIVHDPHMHNTNGVFVTIYCYLSQVILIQDANILFQLTIWNCKKKEKKKKKQTPFVKLPGSGTSTEAASKVTASFTAPFSQYSEFRGLYTLDVLFPRE